MAEQKDAFAVARDEGFTSGTVAALACVTAQDCGVLWAEIVRAAGVQQVLQHALTNEGDWEWAGFERYAGIELGQQEVTKARRAVAAAKRRNAGVAWVASTADVSDKDAMQSVLTGRSLDEIRADVAKLRADLADGVSEAGGQTFSQQTPREQ